MIEDKPIALLGYACGWGAKKRGCADGPAVLYAGSLCDELVKKGKDAAWEPILLLEEDHNIPDTLKPIDALPLVEGYCQLFYEQVEAVFQHGKGKFPLALGGDHSMAMATWSAISVGLQAEGQFGLLWVDAHMDSHTQGTTPSGAYHGMPLAALLGYGEKTLVTLGSQRPKLHPSQVCIIGVRSYEAEEEALLQRIGVRVIKMDEIHTRGLADIMQEAIAIVTRGTKAWGMSIDLDAFDPQDVPGIGSPVKDGIRVKDWCKTVASFPQLRTMAALEIAEFNPHLDREGITEKAVRAMVGAMV